MTNQNRTYKNQILKTMNKVLNKYEYKNLNRSRCLHEVNR